MNIFETVYEINKSHPEKRAMSVTMDNGDKRVYTYGEVFEAVDKYAQALLSVGIKEGDRIAFAAENSPEWNIAFFAACKIHCTSAFIDASLTADGLKEYIERSDVRAAFFSTKIAERFENFDDFNFPIFNVTDCKLFDASVTEVPKNMPQTADADPDVACIIFSSGTTRKAAGIMHRHESLIKTTQMTINVQGLNSDDRFLGIIPNSHIYGLVCLILGPAYTGGDVHYIETIAADAILGAFAEYHPTILPAVPKVYELFRNAVLRKINSKAVTRIMFEKFFPICLEKRRKNGSLLGKKLFKSIHDGFGGSLRVLCSAGSPLSAEVAEFYYGTGFDIIITYGATETNIPTIGNIPENLQTDSCGKPYPVVDIKISDSGELLLKSPYMMKGYFRDEEATKEAFTDDGWFKSGDMGFVDDKGFVHITGRSKENIVLATGKKITPDDIEEKYTGITGAKEMVICGVPVEDKDYDEVHIFIVPELDNLKEKIEAQIREKGADLVQYMKVAKIHFVNEIPRTSLSKPKRYLLKKLALDERVNGEDAFVGETADEVTEVTVLSKVTELVAKAAATTSDSVTPETAIFSDLAIDSLSTVDLALEIEDIYGVNVENSFTKTLTVSELVSIIENGGEGESNVSEADCNNYPQEKTDKDYRAYSFVKNAIKTFHKVKVEGAEKIPTDNGYIICANHVSKLDYLYVSEALPKDKFQKLCCMAKKELFRNDPFSRQLVKSTGMVPVDRGGINNSKSMKALCRKLNENWGVIIHPEGTRSTDGIFREMKNGASVLAIEAGVPIVPCYINGALEACPKNTKLIKFYDWENKKKFEIDVVFGEPIYPDGKSTDELTVEVQNAILELQKKFK